MSIRKIVSDISNKRALDFMEDPSIVIIGNTSRIGQMTEGRIYKEMRDKEHDDVKIVQVRHDDSDWSKAVTIEDKVIVNRFADMIVSHATYDKLLSSEYNMGSTEDDEQKLVYTIEDTDIEDEYNLVELLDDIVEIEPIEIIHDLKGSDSKYDNTNRDL